MGPTSPKSVGGVCLSWDSRLEAACCPVRGYSRNGRLLPFARLPAFVRGRSIRRMQPQPKQRSHSQDAPSGNSILHHLVFLLIVHRLFLILGKFDCVRCYVRRNKPEQIQPHKCLQADSALYLL
jgi:hypothetical protein